eukprot:NODE_1947_length_1028_cov_57.410623_g1582_i0.p2 GENE.NODE_1947_length_1028_cov_57.410623_g1582_i0~~NODE_1947_length_1028_cov_57.410623_g1582_i0.p2  ORF type:complete len:191 (+),score=35.76 NODE_1947_length_1028_cov_57.410623_g1582_i0:378-950(+)
MELVESTMRPSEPPPTTGPLRYESCTQTDPGPELNRPDNHIEMHLRRQLYEAWDTLDEADGERRALAGQCREMAFLHDEELEGLRRGYEHLEAQLRQMQRSERDGLNDERWGRLLGLLDCERRQWSGARDRAFQGDAGWGPEPEPWPSSTRHGLSSVDLGRLPEQRRRWATEWDRTLDSLRLQDVTCARV